MPTKKELDGWTPPSAMAAFDLALRDWLDLQLAPHRSTHAGIGLCNAEPLSSSSARKGIILAGGSGSRLHPITQAVSK